MAEDNPFGFRASRHLNGSNCFSTNTYMTSAVTDLWIGQLVTLVSGNIVEASSTSTTPMLGVISALYKDTKNRPLTHNQPTRGPYILAGTASAHVEVYIDPDIIYEVLADSAMSTADIGQVGDIVTNASGNPSTGVSLQQADSSTFVAITSATHSTLPLMLVGPGKRDEIKIGTGFGDRNVVEVIINNHVFRPKTGISQ